MRSISDSPIEDKLHHELVIFGIPPVTQHVVGPYRIDLAYPDLKVGVECDGRQWHSEDRDVERDNRRTRYLEGQGWVIVRFPGWAIHRYAKGCASMLGLRYLEPLITPALRKEMIGQAEIYLLRTQEYIDLYDRK